MKICPFVSHLLGEGNSSTLSIDESGATDNVVILGYEDGSSKKTTSKAKTKAKRRRKSDSSMDHLHCLKEACRFYQTGSKECQFDVMFTMLKDQDGAPAGADPKELSKQLSTALGKDIDKIWKFQTKSVSEMVKVLGENEKSNTKTVNALQKSMEKKIDGMATKMGKSGGGLDSNVKKTLDGLKKAIDDRDEGLEDLSTTLSDVVINMHEAMEKLSARSENVAKQLDTLKGSMPKGDEISSMIEKALGDRMKKMQAPDLSGELRSLEKHIEKTVANIDVPDMSKQIRDLERQFKDAVKNIKIPDMSSQLRELGKNIEGALKNQDQSDPEIDKKLNRTLDAHRDLEHNLSQWQESITDGIGSLRHQQEGWERRLDQLSDQQRELVDYIEDGKRHMEREEARTGKKEAKKYNNLGVTSFHNGAYEMARDQFLQAVKVDSDFAEAYNNLGLAYTELNEEDMASEAFRLAVELNPSLHAAYNNLGYIFFKQGDYDQAIEMYNEALGRSTNNTSAYTNLGNAYYKLDQLDSARKAWSKALDLDPGNEKARKNLERIREEVSR